MKKRITALFLFCAIALGTGALPSFAATIPIVDSSKMDLTAINAVSGVPSIPVGLIITWGAGNNPHDAEKWLECDGSAFSADTYPDLSRIYTNLRVPDYRDQFLRGGGVAQVGQMAADSTRSHAHQIDEHSHTVTGSASGQSYSAPSSSGGSFLYIDDARYSSYYIGGVPQSSWGSTWNPSGGGYKHITSGSNTGGGGDVSFAMPVGGGGSTAAITGGGSITGIANAGGPTSTYASGETETAPQHIRVRYLIRALP